MINFSKINTEKIPPSETNQNLKGQSRRETGNVTGHETWRTCGLRILLGIPDNTQQDVRAYTRLFVNTPSYSHLNLKIYTILCSLTDHLELSGIDVAPTPPCEFLAAGVDVRKPDPTPSPFFSRARPWCHNSSTKEEDDDRTCDFKGG